MDYQIFWIISISLVWGHPHYTTTSSSVQFSSSHHSNALSLPPSLSTSANRTALLGASASETTSASHAYRLQQLTNGRLDWTAGDQNKRRPVWPTNGHLEGVTCLWHIKKVLLLRHIKKQETMPECLATMPCGPGTPSLSWACSSSLWPAPATATTSNNSPWLSGQALSRS
jgi:hypothetical protein